jgi:hypothetical protein
VCKEDFVLLRNLSATIPPISLSLKGHSIESSIQNSKNQKILEMVNNIMPLFKQSSFTVYSDREIVENLLLDELVKILPSKMEYHEYVGEWNSRPWRKEELRNAFKSKLELPYSQNYAKSFKHFDQKVPKTIKESVLNNYKIQQMPSQNEWTWLTLLEPSKEDYKVISVIIKSLLISFSIVIFFVVFVLFSILFFIFY